MQLMCSSVQKALFEEEDHVKKLQQKVATLEKRNKQLRERVKKVKRSLRQARKNGRHLELEANGPSSGPAILRPQTLQGLMMPILSTGKDSYCQFLLFLPIRKSGAPCSGSQTGMMNVCHLSLGGRLFP
ncbi:Coiled-coil domain-containing protein 3 [Tupaia chinensis]|uniref:Coiled-coil domain-containing protein 3 n=1 Tax=Tupaia chinensis TaxID=246437 RepID=L9KPV4_TUPCH|nr:Coiled-coil domain-containing protein 3 [Tupaia chinensis]